MGVIPVQPGVWHLEFVQVGATRRGRSRRRHRKHGEHSVLRDLSSIGRVRQLDAVKVDAGWMIRVVYEAYNHGVVNVDSQRWPRNGSIECVRVRHESAAEVNHPVRGDDGRLEDCRRRICVRGKWNDV